MSEWSREKHRTIINNKSLQFNYVLHLDEYSGQDEVKIIDSGRTLKFTDVEEINGSIRAETMVVA